jgi:hypothetical protein
MSVNTVSLGRYFKRDYSAPKTMFDMYLRDGIGVPQKEKSLKTLNEILGINDNYDTHINLMKGVNSTMQILFTIGNGFVKSGNREPSKLAFERSEDGTVVSRFDKLVEISNPAYCHLSRVLPMRYTFYPDRPPEGDGVYYLNARELLMPTWYNTFYAKRCATSIFKDSGKPVLQTVCKISKKEVMAMIDGSANIGLENPKGVINEIAVYFGNLTRMQTDKLKNGERFTYYDVTHVVPFYKVVFDDISYTNQDETNPVPDEFEIVFNFELR